MDRQVLHSPHGIVNDDRAQHHNVLELQPTDADLSDSDLWACIYALWLRRSEIDSLPLSLARQPSALMYLRGSGLACSPDDNDYQPTDVLLLRVTFWQGAGAPAPRSWLRTPMTPFPFVSSFTRATNVCTVHPLRPPKPAPGTKMYERYIAAVGQTLSFTHIDAADFRHFETYCKWQNSDRVNIGWRERGDEEHHRTYLAERLEDQHIMGFMVEWDGELAGYGEMSCGKFLRKMH